MDAAVKDFSKLAAADTSVGRHGESRRWPAAGHFVPSMRAPARRRAAGTIKRHLIMAYHPVGQAPQDLHTIGRHVADIDPSIAMFVLNHTRPNAFRRARAATRPTLVVSPGALTAFRPARGKLYQGRPISKIEQIERLVAAGVPVPRTAVLTPDLRLEPADWGEFVILKPTDIVSSSHGHGIQLMRTGRVRYVAPENYPAGHPGRRGPMLVQQFVDTGARISALRVLTLFGEPLYAVGGRSPRPTVDLGASDADLERAIVASQQITDDEAFFVNDPRVLALARAAHEAIPEIPLKGCDILQEQRTGDLYVLELNCGGNTWHFSSRQQARGRETNGAEFERGRRQQFDAFRTAARVLVARTNAEAE